MEINGAENNKIIPDPVLEEALRRTLQIEPDAVITKETLRKLRSFQVKGRVETLKGLEYADNLVEIRLTGTLVDDFSPLYEMQTGEETGEKESQPHMIKVKLENHQTQDVSFLEKIPDESGVQVYLSGQGSAVEKAFEEYCRYEPVTFEKNYGNCIIYGECLLPWLFFEDGTIFYSSDNEKAVKIWGPFYGESVEIKVGDCAGRAVITARAGECLKKIYVTVKSDD